MVSSVRFRIFDDCITTERGPGFVEGVGRNERQSINQIEGFESEMGRMLRDVLFIYTTITNLKQNGGHRR